MRGHITLEMLRAEEERLRMLQMGDRGGGMSCIEIGQRLGWGENKAQRFVRRACQRGLLECRMVCIKNITGRAQIVPRYFVVPKKRKRK